MARARKTDNQTRDQPPGCFADQADAQQASDVAREEITEPEQLQAEQPIQADQAIQMEQPLRLVVAGAEPAWGQRDEAAAGRDSLPSTSPMQIVSDALQYFGRHFQESFPITELASSLGTSEDYLAFSFDRIRGMTPAEALQEHRLNRLFTALSDQPRQGLGLAIRACGLGQTVGVVALFEQTFGIDMPLFLLTCRRAADDRQFRRLHPEPEALVLPL